MQYGLEAANFVFDAEELAGDDVGSVHWFARLVGPRINIAFWIRDPFHSKNMRRDNKYDEHNRIMEMETRDAKFSIISQRLNN